MGLVTIEPFGELHAGLLYQDKEQETERNNYHQHP